MIIITEASLEQSLDNQVKGHLKVLLWTKEIRDSLLTLVKMILLVCLINSL